MPGRFLSFLAGDSDQQKRMVDIILMAALADGWLTQETLDRIARAMQSHPDLGSVPWSWVVERSEELALDAPLFSDTREAIADELSDPEARRAGISLAANIVGAGRPLRDEERAILHQLGVGFGMATAEIEELLNPVATVDLQRFLRSASNDPEDANAPSLFDAMANAKSDDEVRMFAYKLGAIRRIVDELLPGSSLITVGESVRLGPHSARVDAVLDLLEAGQCIVRCVASGEALHPGEHQVLGRLTGELKELSFLMIAYQTALAPMDQAFLEDLDPSKVRVEKVDIRSGVP